MSELKAKTMTEYITERGLSVALVAQKMGVRRQAVAGYAKGHIPNAATLEKVAKAMTALGAKTTVANIYSALYPTGVNK